MSQRSSAVNHAGPVHNPLVMPTTGGTAGPIPPPPADDPAGDAPAGRGGRGRGRGGLPAISVPGGFTASGLPIGLQIAGAPFAESTMLALAHAYEQATSWHERRPRLAV